MKYLQLKNNQLEAVEPVEVSTGPADAGKLVKLNSQGKLDVSLFNLSLNLDIITANLSIVPPFLYWVSQNYTVHYCPMALTNANFSTFSSIANVIYWYPFFVWKKCRINAFVVRVTSASSSATPNLVGIYSSKSDFNPDRLLTSGAYASNITGVRPITLDNPPYLDIGIYWIALLFKTSHTITAVNSGGARSFGVNLALSNPHITLWRSTGYSELPSQVNFILEPLNSTTIPCVAISSLDLA